MRSVMTDSGRYHEFDVFFDKLKISPWFYREERFYANGEIDNEILPHKDSYIFNFCVDHCEDIDIIERKDDLLAIFANIEKYFNNEIKVFFFIESTEGDFRRYFCNDSEELFYVRGYFYGPSTMINGKKIDYYDDFFFDLKELFDAIHYKYRTMPYNVFDILELEKAIRDDNLEMTIDIITNILYKKYPNKKHYIDISRTMLI